MDAPQKPRRPWFQFGLGTMFLVITLLALSLGWQQSYIRERKGMRKWVEQRGGWIMAASDWKASPADPFAGPPPTPIPFWRRWIGDEAIYQIELPFGSPETDLARVKEVFPEAQSFITQRPISIGGPGELEEGNP